jgi:hypothetical protein
MCDCPRCLGVATADPRWGFDRAKVEKADCLRCGEKIGDAPYRLVTTLERFGDMLFVHEKCAKGWDAQPGEQQSLFGMEAA